MSGPFAVSAEPQGDPGKPIKNPIETAKTLAKNLGLGQAIGSRKVPKKVQGFFNQRAKYIAAGAKFASDPATLYHETGHALADKLSMTGTDEMVAKLPQFFHDAYSPEELPGEAFAEFSWRYMTSEADARAFSGDSFYDAFELNLRQNKLYDAVNEARMELQSYLGSSMEARVQALIKDRSYKPKTGLRDTFRGMIAQVFDNTRAAAEVDTYVRQIAGNDYQAGESVRNQMLLRNTADRRAFSILTEGLTDASWVRTGQSLKERWEAVGFTGDKFDTLTSYMTILHSLDRDAQGKPVVDGALFPKAQREAYIKNIQEQHPEVAAAEKAFQEFRHEFLQRFLVDTGYISQSFLDKLEKIYPHYVPTYRVKNLSFGSITNGQGEYQIRAAKGSTEELYNPIDSFVMMANTIVKQVSNNNAALAFHNAYWKYDGLGIFAHAVPSDVAVQKVDTTGLQEKIQKMMEDANADTDFISQIVDAIGEQQVQITNARKVDGPGILSVQLPTGQRVFYEFQDQELFKAFAQMSDQGRDDVLLRFTDQLGKLTRGMAMLTTGSNPLFMTRNAVRDFQKSVNYGSWASNYLTGSAKWIKAFYEVWKNKGEYADYVALGGGGFNRFNPQTRIGNEQYRAELAKGYNTSNAGRTAKYTGQKIWNAVTLARLNEIVEQTSRYAEYRFGQQDKSTAAGKQQAFINAQEATVDFTRTGRGARGLKNLIPFFNAAAQGAYQQGRMLTDPNERSRLPVRFTKTVINVGIAAALSALLRAKFTRPEEQEEFALLSDELRAKYMFIPNFAPAIFGEAPYIRIPLAQDGLSSAVYAAVTNAIEKGEGDDFAIGVSAIASNILELVNPFSGTILDPMIATMTNKNWYGSNIVPRYLQEGYPQNPELQYTESTPDVFTEAASVLNKTGLANVSPMMLEYITGQYGGFLGQIMIPAATKNESSGDTIGLSGAIAQARKQFTSDPLKSNDVISALYDAEGDLKGITKAVDDGKPLDVLRYGLTDAEKQQAYKDAYALTHAGGAIYVAKQKISEGYAAIAEIDSNTTLTAKQKYQLTSEIRRDMLNNALDAQEQVGTFREKYVSGKDLTSIFTHNPTVKMPTAYEEMDPAFRNAQYQPLIEEVWSATGKEGAVPHYNLNFERTVNGQTQQFELTGEDAETYQSAYRRSYEQYLRKNTRYWDTLSIDDKLKMLQNAHNSGHNAGKEAFYKTLGR